MGGAVATGSPARDGKPFVLKHHRRALCYCAFFVLGAILYGYDGLRGFVGHS